MVSVNDGAAAIAERMIADAASLGVEVSQHRSGATLIDCTRGGHEAGRLYAEATMGGLASVELGTRTVAGHDLVMVAVETNRPLEACWVAQKHADRAPGDPADIILAGPAKARFVPTDPTVAAAGYIDRGQKVVAPLQVDRALTDDDFDWLARRCQVEPRDLYVLVAPSDSVVCAVQVVARTVDNAMHRLVSAGVGLFEVERLAGEAPLPPDGGDARQRLGRINDSLMYGSSVRATVSYEGELQAVADEVASQPADLRGLTFLEMFDRFDGDFHQIPLDVFCITSIEVRHPSSGSVAFAGRIDEARLAELLGYDDSGRVQPTCDPASDR